MSEMVERVARAIAEARFGIGCPVDDDDRIAARAAIETMYEPTMEMIVSGEKSVSEGSATGWRAMIDAALTETQASSPEIAVQQQPEKQDG